MDRAFTSSAAYYEILADSEARLKREKPFLADMLRSAPGNKVVDMACGTGFHAVLFAGLGASVDAFDLSAEMIAHARKHHAHPSITYRAGDMRSLEGGPWDCALCLGNSLSLLETPRDLADTFRAVHSSLAPQGVFIIQLVNYQAQHAQETRHRIEKKTAGDSEVIAVKSLVPHGAKTLLSLAFFRVHSEPANLRLAHSEPIEHVSESSVLSNWTRGEIEHAAADVSFRVTAVYGGYDYSAFNPDSSPDLILRLANLRLA